MFNRRWFCNRKMLLCELRSRNSFIRIALLLCVIDLLTATVLEHNHIDDCCLCVWTSNRLKDWITLVVVCTVCWCSRLDLNCLLQLSHVKKSDIDRYSLYISVLLWRIIVLPIHKRLATMVNTLLDKDILTRANSSRVCRPKVRSSRHKMEKYTIAEGRYS